MRVPSRQDFYQLDKDSLKTRKIKFENKQKHKIRLEGKNNK